MAPPSEHRQGQGYAALLVVRAPKDTGPEHLSMPRPGCESAINRSARSIDQRGPPTALLDHRKHASNERKGAAADGGVDLGDGSGNWPDACDELRAHGVQLSITSP